MATGHILPGFGDPVTRLRRAHTAYPMDRTKLKEFAAAQVPPLEQRTLDQIRENARNMWLAPDREPTTYNRFHNGRPLDEPTWSRPSSPSRRHKPHPKQVFLTNRLHYIEPFHNPDATMGKDVYRVDSSRDLPEDERARRLQGREKYIARPTSAAINQYNDPWAPLTDAVGPTEAWGAQAWLKEADDKDQHEVYGAVKDFREKDLYQVPTPPPGNGTSRPHTAIPSMHRWMKMAGHKEVANVRQTLEGMYANPSYHPSSAAPLGYVTGNQQAMRMSDIAKTKKTRYVHKSVRGEYSMHPEWPPTIYHHRID